MNKISKTEVFSFTPTYSTLYGLISVYIYVQGSTTNSPQYLVLLIRSCSVIYWDLLHNK